MIRFLIPTALLCFVVGAGCDSSSSVQDWSKKPKKDQPAPYVPAHHKHSFETPNKGTTQPFPRQNRQSN